MRKRLTEHKFAVRETCTAVHVDTTLHAMNWEIATVLDEEQQWARQRVKKSIHIKERTSRGTAMNLD